MKDQQNGNNNMLLIGGDEMIKIYSDKFAKDNLPWADTEFDREGRMIVRKEDVSSLKVGYLFTMVSPKQIVFGKVTKIDGTAVYFKCWVKPNESNN